MSYFVQKGDNYVFFLPLYHSGTVFLWAPFYATGATGTLLREFVIGFAKSKLALYKAPRRVIFDPVMRNPTGKLMKPQMREKYTGRQEAFHQLD
jgi:acyl-CoA synthetase (AMP-forming)/AMP-acid ligase II